MSVELVEQNFDCWMTTKTHMCNQVVCILVPLQLLVEPLLDQKCWLSLIVVRLKMTSLLMELQRISQIFNIGCRNSRVPNITSNPY